MYISNSGTLVVDANEAYTDDQIEIKASNTFTVSGTQALITHDFDNDGNFITSGTIRVEGSWENDASASFTHAGGPIVFSGTTSETITSNGDSFMHVHINDGLIWVLAF